MPNPTDLHVVQSLTNVAIGYPTQEFLGPQILQDVPVMKQSDKYFLFDSAQRKAAQHADHRAPGAAAREVDFDVTTATYVCEAHALSKIVSDEERENADPAIQADISTVEYLTQRLLLNQDIALKAAIDAAVTGDYTSDPTNEWDDYTSGDPDADLRLAINQVEDATGITPNTIAMDSKVWRALANHPDMIDRVDKMATNERPGQLNAAGLQRLYGLRVAMAAISKNTAVEGQTTAVKSRVWGSDVYLFYQPPRPGLNLPAFGYRFVWRPFSGGAQGYQVTRVRQDARHGDLIEIQRYYDQKITLATAAYRLQNRLS